MGALGLGGEKPLRKIKALSGGEKARVALSMFALKASNLLMLVSVILYCLNAPFYLCMASSNQFSTSSTFLLYSFRMNRQSECPSMYSYISRPSYPDRSLSSFGFGNLYFA